MSPFRLPHVPVFVFRGYRISQQQCNCTWTLSPLPLNKFPHVPITNAQVVSMDACHLKGSWNGVMYILSMKNSNNKLIHVATILADKENETNYRFLLDQTCKNELMRTLFTSGQATFYTDGHRGSPPAITQVVPLAPVRTCLRHLITNSNMRRMGNVSKRLCVYGFLQWDIFRTALPPTS